MSKLSVEELILWGRIPLQSRSFLAQRFDLLYQSVDFFRRQLAGILGHAVARALTPATAYDSSTLVTLPGVG